jgi:hypothetical protein
LRSVSKELAAQGLKIGIPSDAELLGEEAAAAASDPLSVMEFLGGEEAGLARVEEYVWENEENLAGRHRVKYLSSATKFVHESYDKPEFQHVCRIFQDKKRVSRARLLKQILSLAGSRVSVSSLVLLAGRCLGKRQDMAGCRCVHRCFALSMSSASQICC